MKPIEFNITNQDGIQYNIESKKLSCPNCETLIWKEGQKPIHDYIQCNCGTWFINIGGQIK